MEFLLGFLLGLVVMWAGFAYGEKKKKIGGKNDRKTIN